MAFTNLLNDSIIRIRNSQENKKSKTNLIKSGLSINILKVLRNEGYLRSFIIKEKTIEVSLKYFRDRPAIKNIKYHSRLNEKINLSYKELNYLYKSKEANSGLSLMILSTPLGILTDFECLTQKIGGKLILTVL
jgi:small subunit ribosomal protein S8